MSEYRTSQDWTTVKTTATTPGATVIQDLAGCIDAGGEEALNIRVQITAVANGSLAIQTAASYEGPWLQTESFTAVTDKVITLLTHFAAPTTNRLRRYARWIFTANNGQAGLACFRTTYASGVLSGLGR